MALFEQKIWTDRQVQFPARRKLTNVNTQEEKTVLVERNEGIIYEEGNRFDAANINDLEERIAAAFNEIESFLNDRINLYYPVGKIFMSVVDFRLEDPGQQIFPGTTWERLENRALLPIDPEEANAESGVEGGSNTLEVTVSAKSISANTTIGNTSLTKAQLPLHTHTLSYTVGRGSDASYAYGAGSSKHYTNFDPDPVNYNTNNASNGSYHNHGVSNQNVSFTGTKVTGINNMQKFITIYAWRRTT